MRGNNTASNADGKSEVSAFVFPYPYTAAAKLWFKVTAVMGGTRSDASELSSLGVVVGKCAAPWCGAKALLNMSLRWLG